MKYDEIKNLFEAAVENAQYNNVEIDANYFSDYASNALDLSIGNELASCMMLLHCDVEKAKKDSSYSSDTYYYLCLANLNKFAEE